MTPGIIGYFSVQQWAQMYLHQANIHALIRSLVVKYHFSRTTFFRFNGRQQLYESFELLIAYQEFLGPQYAQKCPNAP